MVICRVLALLLVCVGTVHAAELRYNSDQNTLSLTLENAGWAGAVVDDKLWLISTDEKFTAPAELNPVPLTLSDSMGVVVDLPQGSREWGATGAGLNWQLTTENPVRENSVIMFTDGLSLVQPPFQWRQVNQNGQALWVAIAVPANMPAATPRGELLPAVRGVWFRPNQTTEVTAEGGSLALVGAPAIPTLPALVTPTAEIVADGDVDAPALPFDPASVQVPAVAEVIAPQRRTSRRPPPDLAEDIRVQFDQTMDQLIDALFAIENVPTPGARRAVVEWQVTDNELVPSGISLPVDGEPIAKPQTPEVEVPTAPDLARFLAPPLTQIGNLSYRVEEEQYLRAVLRALPSERARARRDLAQFYLRKQRPAQALGVVSYARDDSPDGYLISAVALALQDEFEEAQERLQKVRTWPADLKPHADVWQAYLHSQEGKPGAAAALYAGTIEETSTLYPLPISQQLWLSYGEDLLTLERFDDLIDVVTVLTLQTPDGDVPAAAMLLQAKSYIAQGNSAEAERLLADIANRESDPTIAYEAQYVFVKNLLERGDLSRDLAIGHMEDLRRLWRGTKTEEKILYDLGHLYRDELMFRESLERFRTYTTYFPDAEFVPQVTAKMTRIFMATFEPQNVELYDQLAVLGMYYDFRELTAAGDVGDELINDIGARLQSLSLLERAIHLYERQLATRVENPVNRAMFGAILAELYPLVDEVEKGFEVLEQTASTNLPTDLKTRRAVAKAHLHLEQNEWAQAVKNVAGLLTAAAERVRIEAAWGAEDLATLARILEGRFITPRARPWSAAERADALRYMYALHQLGRPADLINLLELQENQLKRADLLAQVQVLLLDLSQPLEEVGGEGTLAKVARGLQEHNSFVADYNTTLEARLDEIIQREKFNRMRRQPTGRRMDGFETAL